MPPAPSPQAPLPRAAVPVNARKYQPSGPPEGPAGRPKRADGGPGGGAGHHRPGGSGGTAHGPTSPGTVEPVGLGRAATVRTVRTARVRGARPKPRRRFPPEVLTDTEVRTLMAACGTRSLAAARNRALIALLYRTGLRVSEALALRPKDMDLSGGAIRVLHGKGDTFRTVGIDPGAAAVVAEWLGVRAAAGVNGVSPVFCTRSGGPVQTGYVRILMGRLARKAGIDKRVHAHGLRHTHAAQLREEGVDVGIISRQLGHRSIVTTARYLDHIQPMAVVDAMRTRSWPG